MFWVNIDKPTKKCVIHREECPWVDWVKNEARPEFKGIEELKRDGGWFSFDSMGKAENYYETEWEPRGYVLTIDYCISR